MTLLVLTALLQASNDGAAKWETFTSASGFSVRMPGNPIEQKETESGTPDALPNITVMSRGGEAVYLVMRIPMPTAITQAQEAQYFQELRQESAKSSKMLSEKPVTFAGRDYVLEIPGEGGEILSGRFRYVLMKPDLTFNFQVLWSKGKPGPSEREITAFFESLKLVDAATAQRAAKSSKLEFALFAPPKAGFKILMPDKPTASTERMPGKDGGIVIDIYSYNTILSHFAVTVQQFGPTIANLSAEARPRVLAKATEAFVTIDNKGQIVQQKEAQFMGFPARMVRFTVAAPGAKAPILGKARLILVGARLYIVSIRAAADQLGLEDADKFFNSFELTDAASPATTKAEEPTASAAPPKARGPARPLRPGMTSRLRGPLQLQRPERPSQPRAERISWKKFNSAAGGFTIDRPGEPNPDHKENGLLGTKGVEVFTTEHNGTQFIVQYQDLPRSTLRKGATAILKAARNSDPKVMQGKVVGEQEAKLKGAVGWSYQIESPEPDGPLARARTCLVGERLYQVIATAPKTKFPTDDSDRFFRSFRLQIRS
jgi:hypothetical protein